MRILSVFAHPDDEIIWGWPINQNKNIERHIVILSNNNKQARTEKVIKEIKEAFNFSSFNCLNINNEFYRLPTRFNKTVLLDCIKYIKESLLKLPEFDYYFTHNPNGEYGHGDHKLCFQIMAELFGTKVIYGNAFYEVDHYSYNIKYIKDKHLSSHIIDKTFINKGIDIYKKNKAWTWFEEKVPTKLELRRLEC